MKKSKPKATPEDSREGIQKANLKGGFKRTFKFYYCVKANELLIAR